MKKLSILFLSFIVCSCVLLENMMKDQRDVLNQALSNMQSGNFESAYDLLGVVEVVCYDTNTYKVHQLNGENRKDCPEKPLYVFTLRNTALLQFENPEYLKKFRLETFSKQLQSLERDNKTNQALNNYRKIAEKVLKNNSINTDYKTTIEETIKHSRPLTTKKTTNTTNDTKNNPSTKTESSKPVSTTPVSNSKPKTPDQIANDILRGRYNFEICSGAERGALCIGNMIGTLICNGSNDAIVDRTTAYEYSKFQYRYGDITPYLDYFKAGTILGMDCKNTTNSYYVNNLCKPIIQYINM